MIYTLKALSTVPLPLNITNANIRVHAFFRVSNFAVGSGAIALRCRIGNNATFAANYMVGQATMGSTGTAPLIRNLHCSSTTVDGAINTINLNDEVTSMGWSVPSIDWAQ